MEGLAKFAEGFIGLFQTGGNTFLGLVTGIVPLLIVLMTGVNALIALIGSDKIERVGKWAARDGIIYYPIRYILLPFLSVFFLTNPMAYTMGRFLPEKVQTCVLRFGSILCASPPGNFPPYQSG